MHRFAVMVDCIGVLEKLARPVVVGRFLSASGEKQIEATARRDSPEGDVPVFRAGVRTRLPHPRTSRRIHDSGRMETEQKTSFQREIHRRRRMGACQPTLTTDQYFSKFPVVDEAASIH